MGSKDQDHLGQPGETPSLLKIQKISWAWWCMPLIPATQEAEAGELLEPRRWRLRWAEITPLHSSVGNKRETPSQKKIKIKINKRKDDQHHQTLGKYKLKPWSDATTQKLEWVKSKTQAIPDVDQNAERYRHLENTLAASSKFKPTWYDSVITLQDSYPRKLKLMFMQKSVWNVYSSSIHNHQKLEVTQMSPHGWMDKM